MKKLILLVSFLSAFSFGASAQYYYFSHANAGQNPGNLNQDDEYPIGGGLASDWALIDTGSSVPSWSHFSPMMPFAFKFNGTTVTQYKVSTSGVLTFDVSAVTPPPFANTAIPSASIPDNSIMAWGIKGLNANHDYIVTKTFGNAPNRQHWVMFNSYSAASGCYTYWSIVMEETTNKIYIVDMRNGGCAEALTVGIQVNNSTAVSVTGSPSVPQLAGSDPSPADNSFYEFIPGTIPANDAALYAASVSSAIKLAPSTVSISGKIENMGSAAITAYTIKYTDGTTVYSYPVTSVTIASGQVASFTHSTPFNVAAATTYNLKVWVETSGDNNHANDTANTSVRGIAFVPQKNLVFEVGTGTWCGWCPAAAVYSDSISEVHPDRAFVIDVHDYDPMMDLANDTAYDNAIYPQLSGYPGGVIDHKYADIDPFNFLAAYNDLSLDTVACEVSVTTSFNSASRLLTVNVMSHVASDLNGDFRVSAVVTEEDVHGTSSSWAQRNYYSSTSANYPNYTLIGAGHNWETESDPVAASKMTYNHVERALFGGYDGLPGSLPSSMSANGTYQHTFTYTVPSGFNVNNLKVIGWMTDASTGEIMNAGKANAVTGINEEAENAYKLIIYPNPSTGLINIMSVARGASIMKLSVMNSIGEIVKSFDKLNFSIDQVVDMSSYSNGLYFFQFTDENNKSFLSKVLINR
jgi:hypothetical protein